MKAKHLSKARRLDTITTLPQSIIETILCLLPIKQAARTSILSREWRYKWTTIPKLVFCRYTGMYHVSERKMARVVHQVLLLRQAPIDEFTLSIFEFDSLGQIDQIIFHLSRNHPVKKLTLALRGNRSYKLPLSLFSMHHLTELNLDCCDLLHQPTFNGFASLTSLSLVRVNMSKETLLHLLSNCPSLKSLCLLPSYYLDIDEVPTIMELFKCLPAIEHLTTFRCFVKCGVEVSVPRELPISLPHLKYFCFDKIRFADYNGLPFLCVLIKCSPNVEKIKLEISWTHNQLQSGDVEDCANKLEECSDCWFEHLNELEIEDKNNYKFKLTMELVKFMLARSPNLKKLILGTWMMDKIEELEMLKLLLRTPKASSAEIIVNNSFKD